MLLVDGAKPEKRALNIAAMDAGIVVGIASSEDPRVVGATLRIRTTAGCSPNPSPCNDAYELPASGWALINKKHPNKGYKYHDGKRVHGPVKSVVLAAGKKLTVSAAGAGLGHALAAPPAPVDAVLAVGSNRYCMSFGGTLVFKPGKKLTAKKAPAPATCPSDRAP